MYFFILIKYIRGLLLNRAKAHATARGLQLPKCSINQRGQQPIADE